MDAVTLALDASLSGSISCAASADGRLASVELAQRPAEALAGAVEHVLAQVGAPLRALRTCIVGVGPGSFTGIRCAVTFANALAYGTGCEVRMLGSLEAIAFEQAAAGEVVAVAMDAGRGRCHFAAYRREPASLTAVLAQATVEPQALTALLAGTAVGRLVAMEGVSLHDIALPEAVTVTRGLRGGPDASLYLSLWEHAPQITVPAGHEGALARYLSPALRST